MLTAPKRLKLRTSTLRSMFSGSEGTWSLKFFENGGLARVMWSPNFLGVKCSNSLGGDMHSEERLLVPDWFVDVECDAAAAHACDVRTGIVNSITLECCCMLRMITCTYTVNISPSLFIVLFDVINTYVGLLFLLLLFRGRTRTAYLYYCVWSGITGR